MADAIGNFPPIEAGQLFDGIPNHKTTSLSELNLRRIRATAHNGGSRTDWPEELVLNCHRVKGSGHTDVYGRMAWNEVSPTLTSKCCSLSNGRFGHPEQDRAISLREAAIFQTFPENYQFAENNNIPNPSIVCRQIGNAVPPMLGQVIARSIKEHLKQYKLWQEKN